MTVAVLPLPPQNSVRLLPLTEVEFTAQRGSGPGGQHRNKTDSAVRAVHLPSRLTVFTDGRSQTQNKEQALRILSAKVSQATAEQAEAVYSEARKMQLDGGGRGNKIRTYNLIDGRAVDHRSGKMIRQVDQVLEKGRFDLLLRGE